jgi:hypothetical protein
MSYEGRVTPSEVMQDVTPVEVTPCPGEAALDKWRASEKDTVRALNRVSGDKTQWMSSRRYNQ